ncbi:MAG TPA: hypothetical protein VEP90_00405 [Methylomirabilota bacterium]|nr:hypothetical protein [Methylomirabilota bacterium]
MVTHSVTIGTSPVNFWVNAVVAKGGTVSDSRKNLIYPFVNGLIADGVWGVFDRFWLFGAENETAALLDLVNLQTAVKNGAPSFTVNQGYTGVDLSTTVYIDSSFNPATASGVNYLQTSAHVSVWVNTNVVSTNGASAIGIHNATTGIRSLVNPRDAADNLFCRANTNTGGPAGVSNTNAVGFYISDVAGGPTNATCTGYKNGSQVVQTTTQTSGSLADLTGNVYILNCNTVAGTAAQSGCGCQVTAASIGGHLTAAQVTSFYNRLRTYMTGIGVP